MADPVITELQDEEDILGFNSAQTKKKKKELKSIEDY
jgi:hypothetical protein